MNTIESISPTMSSTLPTPLSGASGSNAPHAIPTCKVILANTIVKSLLAEVAKELSELSFKPKLVGFLANGDPAAQAYADYSAKTCKEK